jgi:hypothetical protein
MDCEGCREHLVDYVLGDDGAGRGDGIEAHLANCAFCAGEEESIRRVVQTLRETDEAVNKTWPDRNFRNRVIRKVPHRRRDSVVLVRQRAPSRAPLLAALTAAAVLLAVVIYVLVADSYDAAGRGSSETWAGAPKVDRASGTPQPDNLGARPSESSRQPAKTPPRPSSEADQKGRVTDKANEEPEEDPVGPVPAQSPVVIAEKPEDVGPIAVSDDPETDPSTEMDNRPLKDYVARLYQLNGEVRVKRSGKDTWDRGQEYDKIFKGDTVTTSSKGGGLVLLSIGGAAVMNRSTVLNFVSHSECELGKGEVLASCSRRPLLLSSGGIPVKMKHSDVYIQRKGKELRIVAVKGKAHVGKDGRSSTVESGKGIIVKGDGRHEKLEKVNVASEIEWVNEAGKKFKLWIEGECCRHNGFFVVQQAVRNLSNCASVYKAGRTGYLSWRVRLPHATPCYVWVRYARNGRESEDIGLVVNCRKVGEKTISSANAKWVWIKAFKVTFGRHNDVKLYLSSKKPVESRVDLILITNDRNFRPSTHLPRGGYYGKK